MTIIIEDGTQVVGAESYVTTDFCDTYHANRNNTGWAAIASSTLKEGYIRQAMAYLETNFRGRWKGTRVTSVQMLDWPRWGCQIDDVTLGQVAYYIPYNVIPLQLQNVVAELALFAVAGFLDPNLQQGIITKKVGPLAVTYDPYSPQSPRYPIVNGYLRIFMTAGNGSGRMSLSRT